MRRGRNKEGCVPTVCLLSFERRGRVMSANRFPFYWCQVPVLYHLPEPLAKTLRESSCLLSSAAQNTRWAVSMSSLCLLLIFYGHPAQKRAYIWTLKVELLIPSISFYPKHFSRHLWSWGDEGGVSNKPRSLAFLISAKTSEEVPAGTHEKPDDSFVDSPFTTNTRPRVYVFPIQDHRGANRFGAVFAQSQESGGNVRGGVQRFAVVLNDSTADCMLGD